MRETNRADCAHQKFEQVVQDGVLFNVMGAREMLQMQRRSPKVRKLRAKTRELLNQLHHKEVGTAPTSCLDASRAAGRVVALRTLEHA